MSGIVIGFRAASSRVLSSVTSPRSRKCGVLLSSNTISCIALSYFFRSDFFALSSITICLAGLRGLIGLLLGLLDELVLWRSGLYGEPRATPFFSKLSFEDVDPATLTPTACFKYGRALFRLESQLAFRLVLETFFRLFYPWPCTAKQASGLSSHGWKPWGFYGCKSLSKLLCMLDLSFFFATIGSSSYSAGY